MGSSVKSNYLAVAQCECKVLARDSGRDVMVVWTGIVGKEMEWKKY